jgi:hypothetical protein
MMNEAHEKTRIRQLEDAAAHWEHKYANARQYNRNLEERCQKLEAVLREMLASCGPYRSENSLERPMWDSRYINATTQARLLLTAPEKPVSTLCAVCDQIKELHPNTHPWTAKETGTKS